VPSSAPAANGRGFFDVRALTSDCPFLAIFSADDGDLPGGGGKAECGVSARMPRTRVVGERGRLWKSIPYL
jgi:hypothetical protein